MNILFIAYNQEEQVKLSIDNIRMFGDVDNISVIVVDNGSTDGLREWASTQEDFTYVYMDEGRLPFGKVINMVKNELALQGDILLMDGNFLITPSCLANMENALHNETNIGAVGPLANTFIHFQNINNIGDFKDFTEVLEWSKFEHKTISKKVLFLSSGAILFNATALNQLGDFDEHLLSAASVIRDYCLRIIKNNWMLKVCESALIWDVNNHIYSENLSNTDLKLFEKKWGMHYFLSLYNNNTISIINKDLDANFSVLEIGCDCGATLLEIKNRYPNAQIYGIEINDKSAEIASHFAKVWVNNIEMQDLECDTKFDYIIFGDVLEHLRDPLKAIIYCKSLLKEDGHIIASIPNLMHISVIDDLLKGNFTYTEVGLLDKTHIHLFTYNEIVKMFQNGGYQIELVRSVPGRITDTQDELIDKLLSLNNTAQRFMYETFQYVISAKKQ